MAGAPRPTGRASDWTEFGGTRTPTSALQVRYANGTDLASSRATRTPSALAGGRPAVIFKRPLRIQSSDQLRLDVERAVAARHEYPARSGAPVGTARGTASG